MPDNTREEVEGGERLRQLERQYLLTSTGGGGAAAAYIAALRSRLVAAEAERDEGRELRRFDADLLRRSQEELARVRSALTARDAVVERYEEALKRGWTLAQLEWACRELRKMGIPDTAANFDKLHVAAALTRPDTEEGT